MINRNQEALGRSPSGYNSSDVCKFEVSSAVLTIAQDAKMAEETLGLLLAKRSKGGNALLKGTSKNN